MNEPSATDEFLAATSDELQGAVHVAWLALAYGRVERGIHHPDGTPESDTTHSVCVAWLACSLASRWYSWLDLGLAARFAIVHDAPEIYAGDTFAVTDTDLAAQERREADAARRIDCELPELDWLPVTIREYESRATPEARFVRIIDKMAPKLVAFSSDDHVQRLRARGVTRQVFEDFITREREALQVLSAGDFPEMLDLTDRLNAAYLARWDKSQARAGECGTDARA